jgi:hypothetical protein
LEKRQNNRPPHPQNRSKNQLSHTTGKFEKTRLKVSELQLSDYAGLPYFDAHSLVFYSFNSEKLTYYKYDIDAKQTQEAGTIKKPAIWSSREYQKI